MSRTKVDGQGGAAAPLVRVRLRGRLQHGWALTSAGGAMSTGREVRHVALMMPEATFSTPVQSVGDRRVPLLGFDLTVGVLVVRTHNRRRTRHVVQGR